jgi:hypothetical protein
MYINMAHNSDPAKFAMDTSPAKFAMDAAYKALVSIIGMYP